ncbi:oxygenase MpaB family protein [Cystobacter ferrugineus]|uniref:Histidine kinase n=1 Tax=Cystobacter ferrugineus TaxID=83449 RepID=A0A1L9BIB2_9BACT|nr:oxygenase MpaB family protein [Cystobacter ferrugineus]OJH42044.1 histidine kinase [Cystobacter ferrugineus]
MALRDPVPVEREAAPAQTAKPAAAREWKVDFLTPAGEPSLVPPDSVQWRVYRNPIVMGIGGVAAVLLEFADPRIRSGVWDHSVYKVDPIGRSRRTGIAAMVGVYGPASVARKVISGVTKMHARVSGETPNGQSYRALDPVLLNWVSATAAFGFFKAYHTFVRPLSPEDQVRFFREGKPVAELYGVTHSVGSEAEFVAMMEELLPGFEPHPINLEFLNIIESGRAAPSVPRFLHRAMARGAVAILPPVVRKKLELGAEWDLTVLDRLALISAGRLADHRRDRDSPAWQAALRHGLPGDFAWRSPSVQRSLLKS